MGPTGTSSGFGGSASYLRDGDGGHLDALLKQHAQDAVLLLQVEDAGPQFHTFFFQVLEETGNKRTSETSDQESAVARKPPF